MKGGLRGLSPVDKEPIQLGQLGIQAIVIEKLLADGKILKADTLEELAAQIGANGENLVKTVAAFNEEVTGN